MTKLSDLHLVLDEIESEEAKLLVWGDTGGSFSEDEIFALIEKALPYADPEEVLDDLEECAIVLPVVNASGMTLGYRSRMAESVHLYRNLRQWFHGKNIEQSSTLVSDYRFLRRARQYPKRNLVLADLINSWSPSIVLSNGIKASLRALVGEFKLSGFQARATERILTAIPYHRRRRQYPSATITCAGTGSGKTMAFYLPALSSIVSDVLISPKPHVRVLAIYPRKELLKDQFNEAWEQCRKLDAIVQPISGRKLRIGAMFGDTPTQLKYVLKEGQSFRTFGFLKCASKGCDGEMRWRKEDVAKNIEVLFCHLCGHAVHGDEVALTRQSMTMFPPDILFTTTEMLNQQMGNPYNQKLFGIGTRDPIPLVLLDEVHTYSGNQGSQTAYLLRRWMRLSKSAPHFVGLSATLADAESFFSRLTGTLAPRVRLVEPIPDEMIEEGAEYLLALRGDPVSQTALLSTTIQTAMLTRRLQDTRRDKKSRRTWGSKTFVFTDDLDINNRLFSQLADAEGWQQSRGQLTPKHSHGPLAQLRNPAGGANSREKLLRYGQDWSAVKNIGFGLNQEDRAIVSKTSAQDPGVDSEAEIVVATASLEVGFNDAEVGAIIQHKAPRDVASYLQRKGRAGRLRSVRPWMLIILSEFGRDRITYQHYERLLDPEIKLQSLPLGNSHIQRMQAAMSTLDWLSSKVKGFNPWSDFNNPSRLAHKGPKLLKLVNEVLEGGDKQRELAGYLSEALTISEHELDQLLWQPPRSIFMEYLPTLRRKLESNWGQWSYDSQALQAWSEVKKGWNSPVPEFIPDNLFSDLNLPTLHIELSRGITTREEGMRFFQGLKEFAPGRVSKRFSTFNGDFSDWLIPHEIKPNAGLHNLVIDFEVDEAFGEIKTYIDEVTDPSTQGKLVVFQPHQIFPTSLPKQRHLSETCNAMLNWQSLFRPDEEVGAHPLPKGSLWGGSFRSVAFHTHRSLSQLEVIRYNTGSSAELKFQNGQRASVRFSWHHESKPIGIGSRLWVDAARLEFKFTHQDLQTWLGDESLLRVLRGSYLQDQLRKEEVFEGNKFKADWVNECFITAITAEVIHNSCSIDTALENVCSGNSLINLADIPQILFQQDIGVIEEGGSSTANNHANKDQKLQVELRALLTSEEVLLVLGRLGVILTTPLDGNPDFASWCRNVIGNTLGAAVQQAVCTLLQDVDERELIVDPIFKGDSLTIWLCEQDSGGAGVILQLQDSYADDPLKFLNILGQTLQSGDYEQLDCDLHALLVCCKSDIKIGGALKQVRIAENYHERVEANKYLRKILIEAGFQFSHSFSAVLYSRILRPGSGTETDQHLAKYLERWDELEEQVGFELPINTVALMISLEKNLKNTPVVIFSEACRIQSVLWPRGNTVRQAALAYYNPFQADNNRTERLLAMPFCADSAQTISYVEIEWLNSIHELLAKDGKADLLLSRERIRDLTHIIAMLHVTPLDTHGLLFYPRVSSIRRQTNGILLCIELAETIQ